MRAARPTRRGRSIVGPTRRAEFGATITLVDMATGDDACIASVTTFEQAWRDAYGTPEAWERERHGTAEQAERERYGFRRRDLTIRDLTDARDAARRVMERRP